MAKTRLAKRPNVVVLGAKGQLAQTFLAKLGSRATGWDRSQFDFAEPEALSQRLQAARPALVINCAAFNQVDLAETQRESALQANAAGPASLARAAAAQGFRLVHFSTDYVFGGDRLTRPRVEADPPAPVNFYGYSKLVGEEAVLREDRRALVLRVAHLFGGTSLSPGRANLVQRFLELARAGQPISVTEGQYLNPTEVHDIVAATLALVEGGETGLFHLTGEGECSAEEFVRATLELARLSTEIRRVERDNRPAPRARYTVLKNLRLGDRGYPPLRHWREALAQAVV